MITLLWRQNDVATSFRRHNDVIIASPCVHWDYRMNSDQCTAVIVASRHHQYNALWVYIIVILYLVCIVNPGNSRWERYEKKCTVECRYNAVKFNM